MTPRKNKTEIFEEVIYYCAIPIDSDNLFDKVTRYIQVNLDNFRFMIEVSGPSGFIGSKWSAVTSAGPS